MEDLNLHLNQVNADVGIDVTDRQKKIFDKR